MYCKNCGAELEPGALFCTYCGTPSGQGNKYCANCGTELAPGAVVCSKCGMAVGVQIVSNGACRQPNQASGQYGTMSILGMIFGIVSVVLMCVGGAVMGIPAIICSAIAIKNQEQGRGMAVAGLITGIISVAITLIFLFVYILTMVGLINAFH